MHKLFRNRFLNTAAFLLDPREPVKDENQQQEPGDDNDANDDANAEGGENAGAAGDDTEGDGEGDDDSAARDDDADDEPGDDEEDDDPDLADLSPEQRKKVRARINKEVNWRDKRINKLTARRRSAEADNEALTTIVDGQRAPAAKPGENLTAKQIEDRAQELAQNISVQNQYDKDCNDAHAKGLKVFGKNWSKALPKIKQLGGIDPSDMLGILTTDKPHVVMHSLADPDTYERVMELPPAKRLTEFVKLSLKDEPKSAKAQESKRPGDGVRPPPRVLSGGRQVAAQSVDLSDDKISDDAWYAARNATRRKKFTNVA